MNVSEPGTASHVGHADSRGCIAFRTQNGSAGTLNPA